MFGRLVVPWPRLERVTHALNDYLWDRCPIEETAYDVSANGNIIGYAELVNGVASFTTDSLAVGTHSMTVSYAGDSLFSSSFSDQLFQQVLI